MSDFDDLPEYYVADDGARVSAPTYEALGPCFMVMTSAETGATGPTKVEEGEIFTSEQPPNDQWRPLNRAAGERYEQWLASLPAAGKGVPQEFITQAAYMLRPREGDPEFPIELWWPKVMQLATQLFEKQRPSVMAPRPASAFRPGAAQAPMPFVSMTSGIPHQPGHPPPNAAQHQPQNAVRAAQRQRQQRVTPPMPNTQGSGPQGA